MVVATRTSSAWKRYAWVLFFLQGFGLGGVIASFGVVLDLIGFVLFLMRRPGAGYAAA